MERYLNAVTGKEENIQGSGGAIDVNVVSGGGVGGGTTSVSGPSFVIGVDTAGVIWWKVLDSSTNPATFKYIKDSDGTTGTPNGTFTPDNDLNNNIPGQGLAKESAIATVSLGSAVAARLANTIFGRIFTFQTSALDKNIRITSVTLASTNPATTMALVNAYAFTSATPFTIADNTALNIPASFLASRNMTAIGPIAGVNVLSTAGVSCRAENLSSNIRTDATGKFSLLFQLRAGYSNIANETLSSAAEWLD